MTNPFGDPGQHPENDPHYGQQNPQQPANPYAGDYSSPQQDMNAGYAGGGYQAGYPGGYPGAYQATGPALAPGKFDAVDSLGQAWKIFTEKLGSWLLSSLIYGGIGTVAFFVAYIPFIAMLIANTDETGEFSGPFPVGAASMVGVGFVVMMVLMILWEMVTYREAVYAVGGKKPALKDFFNYRRCGFLFLVYIVVGLLSMLGLIALIVGAIVVGIFLMFAMPAAVFEDVSLDDALKSSVDVVKNNIGQTLLVFLLAMVISAIGGAVIIGSIFAVPLIYIFYAHAYMTATGRPVQRRP